MIKQRKQRKWIIELQALSRIKITDPTVIKYEIVNFYKSLMGFKVNQLLVVNMFVMGNGHVLNHQ